MKIAIVGSGLAGLTAAVDLVDNGHEVEIYESRSFWGGKAVSYTHLTLPTIYSV